MTARGVRDRFGRRVDYLRISITETCNLRCRYCMPSGADRVPEKQLLSYEEILRIAEACTALGIRKFRVTGGEPLLRPGCTDFLKRLRSLPGTEQVTLTTNGVLLENAAEQLSEAGLDGVNVSLDTLDRERYRLLTGADALDAVKRGIHAALRAGLSVKVNTVLLSWVNADEWPDLVSAFRSYPVDIRFIELMPIGCAKGFQGVNGKRLLAEMKKRFPGMEEDRTVRGNGPARYYRIPGFQGAVGFISPMHDNFCAHCTRLRLTAEGKLKPCLCYADAVDLMPALRGNDAGRPAEGTRKQLEALISRAVLAKPAGHCFGDAPRVTEMHCMNEIGG